MAGNISENSFHPAFTTVVPAPELPHDATMHEHSCGGGTWFGNWSNGGRCQWCGAVLPIAFGSGNQAASAERAQATRRSEAP